jgi:hypothetical protein
LQLQQLSPSLFSQKPIHHQPESRHSVLIGLSTRNSAHNGYEGGAERTQFSTSHHATAAGPQALTEGRTQVCCCFGTQTLRSLPPSSLCFVTQCCLLTAIPASCGACSPCHSQGVHQVREDEVGIVESFGRFARAETAGPVSLRVACGVPLETMRRKVSLRLTQQVVRSETKTRDNVFCAVEVSVQYQIAPDRATAAAVDSVYKIENFPQFLASQVRPMLFSG